MSRLTEEQLNQFIAEHLEQHRATFKRYQVLTRIQSILFVAFFIVLFGSIVSSMVPAIPIGIEQAVPIAFTLGIPIFILIIVSILITGGDVITKTRQVIMPELLKLYGEFQYQPKSSGKADSLLREGLIGPYTRLEEFDSWSGRYRDIDVDTVRARATRTESSGTGNNRKTRTVTVFEGSLMRIEQAASFQGRYILLPRGMRVRGLERIKLESPEFEKTFDFFGNDQIEGRTLMTPRRIAQWSEFTETLAPVKMAASFEQDGLYLALYGDATLNLGKVIKEKEVDPVALYLGLAKTHCERAFRTIDFIAFQESGREQSS